MIESLSEKIYLGRNAAAIEVSPAFAPFTGVRLYAADSTDSGGTAVSGIYEAGSDTGRVLELDCPWGTQAMAERILNQISGYAYRPLAASGALLDPAAELGATYCYWGTNWLNVWFLF